MKIRYYVMVLFSAFLFASCSENITEPQESVSKEGSILFHIDKVNAPGDVSLVKAYLSRTEFDTLTAVLNMDSDSSANITFEAIAVGKWRLRVDALNAENKILYTGEDDVDIKADEIAEAYLELRKVASGIGSVNIGVSWTDYQTLVLQPGSEGKNAYIDQLYPNYNYSSEPYLCLFIGSYVTSQIHRQRAFLDFNLSSNLPSGAKIVKADLYLYYDSLNDTEFPTGHGDAASVVITRITQSWEKTAVKWSNQPAYTSLDSTVFNTSGFSKENFKVDVTQLVQASSNNPESSFGFRVAFANEKAGGLLKLASCNNPYELIRPKLEITYSR